MTAADTIFAVSSGSGVAGIAVIRVSGPEASAALVILTGGLPQPRKASLCAVRGSGGDLIDRALVLWFPGPGTATGEDMAEFHVHGGSAVVGAVLSALALLPGLRFAEPGEFTRRAFLNNRMDLVEAEGLADLLSASTEGQRRQAMYQMSGAASSAYDSWLKRMTAVLARLEAAIDFVDEEGVAEQSLELMRPETLVLIAELEQGVAGAERADVVRGGVRIAIIGPPNVGKSSVLNWLAQRDAAIVSPVAGTTRDAIEVSLVLGGLPVTVIDTAGFREETSDDIEREGMRRAQKAAEVAHIVVELQAPDVAATAVAPRDRRTVRVLNKGDLGTSILDRNDFDYVVSSKTGDGMAELLSGLEQRIMHSYAALEAPVVVRERHKLALQESIRHLNESLTFDARLIEIAAEHVRAAAFALARVTGKVDVEDVLGKIFSEFCIGK